MLGCRLCFCRGFGNRIHAFLEDVFYSSIRIRLNIQGLLTGSLKGAVAVFLSESEQYSTAGFVILLLGNTAPRSGRL